MAAPLPAKLKVPGIQPFAVRAAQLEKFKPIVAYWCNYHVVNQILSKGLHLADDECRDYTTNLMDKLETVKGQTPPVDAIVDDIVAKAYVEQFALETFQKADTAIHTDNASRQTIDTFQAASTFLELLIIWGPLEAETSQKIKYAKYHALRIAKALKAGEDPNASNPKDDLASPTVATGASGDHAMPFQPDLSSPPPAAYQPPTVEDESERTAPPITAPSANMTSDAPEVETAGTSRTVETSQDADYFPPVPTFTSESTASATTTANPDTVMSDPTDFYAQQPTQPPQPALISPPVQQPAVMQPPIPSPHPMPQATVPVHQATLPPSAAAYRTDDESVALAQKHSRWAISALNFEDVPTAVKELRLALQYLGAS